jgi:hypothetical protein
MSEAEADAAAWQSFMSEPASYIDEGQLAHALGNEVGTELAKRLRGSSRLAKRLSALISEREGLPPQIGPDALSADDRKIATTAPDQLGAIVLRAGAILWSGAIANAVRGREVAAIEAALGSELRSFAIEHRAAGGIDRPLEPFETLRERIMADGWRCYAGWCDAVPPAVGLRASLKMPASPDFAPSDLYSEVGPAIMRLAAA